MNPKLKKAIVLNIVVVVCCVLGIVSTNFNGQSFRYYTIDSNILCAISSLLFVIYALIKKEQKKIPAIIMKLRYSGTCCLVVTFVVVVTILPLTSEGSYFDNLIKFTLSSPFIYHHLLCPVISFISFVFLEGDRRLNKKKTIWWAMMPTIVYGVIVVVLNILKVIEGPYPFLMVYKQPIYMSIIWTVVIFLSDYLISRYTLLLNQMKS